MLARTSLRTAAVLSRSASTVAAAPAGSVSLPSLANIEASWKTLVPAEQEAVFKHLEELQKKDWKELSRDEKKAAYYVAFGPHGPREPPLPAGSGIKVFGAVAAAILTAFGVFSLVRSQAPPPVPTLSKEWKEATVARNIEQGANPFSGAASKAQKEGH